MPVDHLHGLYLDKDDYQLKCKASQCTWAIPIDLVHDRTLAYEDLQAILKWHMEEGISIAERLEEILKQPYPGDVERRTTEQ